LRLDPLLFFVAIGCLLLRAAPCGEGDFARTRAQCRVGACLEQQAGGAELGERHLAVVALPARDGRDDDAEGLRDVRLFHAASDPVVA